ncbi:pre-mRNA 3'-end-processing factor FIP1-like isoform X3 [Dendropsophus ebraccatus]|uniref:pre-mRNA 3'-end-processing factor FIP1-like isoform X3 n=1 Tax=Dendropsophus ebraccatus TaxID=150705 RepID=UPI003831101E
MEEEKEDTDSPTPNHDDEETGSTSGHTKSCDTLQDISSGSMEPKDESLQITQSCSDEDESDTDSDDVRVTIGDIRTGAPSCMGPTGNGKGGRGYGAAGKLPPKGIDFSAPGCINGLPVLEVDLDSFEEKPWRKPGADLSDYFNYGFNEATWKVYCEKQRRLQLGLDNTYPHSKENKITVQQGRTGYASKGGENLFTHSDMNIIEEGNSAAEALQNGKQAKAIDVIGGEICSITRVEGRRWDIQDSDDLPMQVVDSLEYKPHPVMQHQQPPPPLLPPPSIVHNPPPFNGLPPPPLFFQRPPPTNQVPPALHPPAMLPPPLLPPPAVHIPPPSGPPVTYNSRPPPRQIYFSNGPGGMNYPAVSTAQTSWVTTLDKGTSSPGRNEWTPRRRQEREMDKIRSQNFNSFKQDSERLINYNRVRSYDYERKYQRSREHSWEKEEKFYGEHRHRDKEESSKHKSSRRKQESEERESHRRHKRKKTKRSKEKSVDDDPPTRSNRHDLGEKATSSRLD